MRPDVEGRLDILLRRQRGQKIVRLEDHADLTVAHGGEGALAHPCDVNPIDENPPACERVQAGDDAE